MSYLDDAKRHERDSAKLMEQARQLRQKAVEGCPHPYEFLRFEYGATTSYAPGRTEHSMIVRCQRCEGAFRNNLMQFTGD